MITKSSSIFRYSFTNFATSLTLHSSGANLKWAVWVFTISLSSKCAKKTTLLKLGDALFFPFPWNEDNLLLGEWELTYISAIDYTAYSRLSYKLFWNKTCWMFDRFLTVSFSTKINNMGLTRCVTEVHTSLPNARAANSSTHIMPKLKKLVLF